MIDQLRVTFLVLAACLAGSPECSAQSGSAFPDGAILNSERLSFCPTDLTPDGFIPLPHTVGCERWDCCVNCPGPPDWRVNVGPDASAVLLRFQNLSRAARKNLVVKGEAKWEKDGQLRLGQGETRISGLRPDRSGHWPVAFMSVAVSKEKFDRAAAALQAQGKSPPPGEPKATLRIGQPQQIAVAVEQFSGKAMVGATNLSILPGACPQGGGGGPGASEGIAVANASTASVTIYPLPVIPNTGGGVPPSREIRGPHTQISIPVFVAADGAGQIYVLDVNPVQVAVFGRGADGDATPIRTLSNADLTNGGLAVDEIGEIFVTTAANDSGDNVSVFAAGAQGNATPTQVITDSIGSPNAIAVSRSGDFLYVAHGGDDNTITVYHRAFGFFSLVETIPAPADVNILVNGGWIWTSIAVDDAGLVYAVRRFAPALPNPPDVLVFKRTANGPFAQERRFFGFVGDLNRIAVDTHGLAYVTVAWFDDRADAVRVFASNSNGPSQIAASIAGAPSQLLFPEAAAILP